MTNFVKDESGQGLAEYALILALIAVVVIATLRSLGGKINTELGLVDTNLNTTVGAGG